MHKLGRWATPVSRVGGVSLVVGSLDPLEGSVLILAGSALLALGSRLGDEDRRTILYRTWSFALVAFGVGALFVLSAIGGVAGSSGRSAWWALLILPYLVGWSFDIWGPGSARWMTIAGIAIGAWYLAILGLVLRGMSGSARFGIAPALTIAVIGLLTIAACAVRLRRPRD